MNFPAEYRQKKLAVQSKREDKALAALQRLEENSKVRKEGFTGSQFIIYLKFQIKSLLKGLITSNNKLYLSYHYQL